MKIKDIKIGDRLTYRGRDHESLFWGAVCEVVSFTGVGDNVEVISLPVPGMSAQGTPKTVAVHATDLVPEGTPYAGR